MTGLASTTIAVAGPVFAEGLDISWEERRDEVVAAINEFRNEMFNIYPDIFANVFHCICTSRFNDACVPHCSTGNFYYGFTIPADMTGVEAIFRYGHLPLVLRSRWRETRTGVEGCGPVFAAVETNRQFCTERDPNAITTLKVTSSRPEDAGKSVLVEVLDSDGKPQVLEYVLAVDEWSYSHTFVREIRGVSLPVGRKGSVTIAQTDGYILSEYFPWESAPSYRRFKVPANCECPPSVLVQGGKAFVPVTCDSEIVEIGDPLVMKYAARFLRYSANSSDAKELKIAEYHRGQRDTQLAGLMKRFRGHAVQDNTPARGRPVTKSTRLPGYGSGYTPRYPNRR